MSHAICTPACALFDLPDVHVLAVERGPRLFALVIETVPFLVGCSSCSVLEAFHVVTLSGQVIDEVRRRVHQDTPGHCGRAGDPLYGIRRTLQIGVEHLTAKQITRLNAEPAVGDPHQEVSLAWRCYQKWRAVYHVRPAQGRQLVAETLAAFPACSIPEAARGFRNLENYRIHALLAVGGNLPWRNISAHAHL
ncbi:hypothetical protein GCM10011374_23810 [Kocuria dechangensis]|uniref:Transposase IS204/IS1001/IS1096/IS1165 DDE domain-containing protein n=1 Tax=Kocuria dechangensis TaxID=1176249 RepID=A0A917GXP8_9MICC|nr:transposase [Kocuria dechangensis]GGG60178.1 hypothetical protein GCM10011374_23810 [Kocuria dechangensis]